MYKDLADILKRFTAPLLALVGFVVTTVNFIKLWRGETLLVTTIIILTAAGVLWLSCLYIFVKKRSKKKRKASTIGRLPYYPQWLHNFALILLIIVS